MMVVDGTPDVRQIQKAHRSSPYHGQNDAVHSVGSTNKVTFLGLTLSDKFLQRHCCRSGRYSCRTFFSRALVTFDGTESRRQLREYVGKPSIQMFSE